MSNRKYALPTFDELFADDLTTIAEEIIREIGPALCSKKFSIDNIARENRPFITLTVFLDNDKASRLPFALLEFRINEHLKKDAHDWRVRLHCYEKLSRGLTISLHHPKLESSFPSGGGGGGLRL